MSEPYLKLYSFSAKPDCVYLLSEGNVFFYASTVDRYVINGKNLIIGAAEVIMQGMLSMDMERVETAVAHKESRIKKISFENFFEGMNNFSFAFNTAMVLAKQVLLTNRIINKNMSLASEDETKTREIAAEHYNIIERLRSEFEKRRLPWLKELVSKHEITLTYKKGEAFCKMAEPAKLSISNELSDKMVEYPRGSIICEENTVGEEMYVLQSGSIDVHLNGKRIASIDETGTVIGEMALLLKEKRSATLKAGNNVVITRIKKSELKQAAQRQDDLMPGIALALARRHYYNVLKIGAINKSVAEKALKSEEEANGTPQAPKAKKDLQLLKRDIETKTAGRDVEFIKDLLDSL